MPRPSSSELDELWSEAREAKREATWKALPERVGEHYDLEGSRATKQDVRWLIGRAMFSINYGEVQAAYRTLAIIGEDWPEHRAMILQPMRDSLRSESMSIRLWATEAIWQIAEVDERTKAALMNAEARETHPSVKKTLKHVLRIINDL